MEYDGTFYGNLVYRTVITYILWPFGIFCGHLVYFVAIWYILWPFGIFCGHLVYIVNIWQPCHRVSQFLRVLQKFVCP
jgi:hypothetical protein